MAADLGDDLLRHYLSELAYLRNAGAEFARRYPQVAGALDLAPQGSADPHVERLIESFAFLTARLQRSYDAQMPEFPAGLLSVLYPQLAAPVPSMSVAEFLPDSDQNAAAAGVVVPAGSTLLARAAPAAGAQRTPTCRFRSGYPVTLWPIEVAEARIEPRALHPFLDATPQVRCVLRIRLRCLGKRSFSEFAPASLRFFLPTQDGDAEALYELLFTRSHGIAVAPVAMGEAPSPAPAMSPARLHPVGFDANEALLPCPPASHQAYRLLQEYFTFPAKFLFFDVAPLPHGALGSGTQADLLLLLTAGPRRPISVHAGSFKLGCAPIINLFTAISEPVRLDHTRLEYRLSADSRAPASTEIHSVTKVTRATAHAQRVGIVAPLFSLRHADDPTVDGAMYYARREPGLDGADMLLSFVDADLQPTLPAEDIVFAHLLCTNRSIAAQIPAGAALQLEIDVPARGVACLLRPTPEIPPPLSGGALWRLVSHLSANHLSIADGADGAAALREILLLYGQPGDAALTRRIAGLQSIRSRRVARRIGVDAWRGFCRGLEISLDYDEQAFAGASAWLMGAVLSRFFGLHAAVNAFTELAMRGRQSNEEWRWPPVTGDTALI